MPTEECHVAGPDCDCYTRCTCYACGLPVCKTCSRVRRWYRWGRHRICDVCWAERETKDAT